MSKREYRVWHEIGDVLGVYSDPGDAQSAAEKRAAECVCGEDAGPEGLFCGVLYPHGVFVQAVEGGQDVTQDYLINGS